MRRTFALAAIAILTFASSAAQGGIYVGNPVLDMWVTHPVATLDEGSAFVEQVEVDWCNGETTVYPVQQHIDPVAGYKIEVDSGAICGVTWVWLDGVDVLGGDFSLSVDEPFTTATIDQLRGTGQLGELHVVTEIE